MGAKGASDLVIARLADVQYGVVARAQLVIDRSSTLTDAETTTVRGLPVTTVDRTIIDLSRTVSQAELERIVDLADQRGLVDFAALESARSASLQAVLRAYTPAPTRSERDVVLSTRGWRTLRFTWRQVETREAWVAAAVTA